MKQGGKYIVYSDGASSNNQCEDRTGAYASVVFIQVNGDTYKKDLSGVVEGATNNQMELKSVIEAWKEILRLDPTPSHIRLVCDSQYTVMGILEWLPKWAENDWCTTGKKKEPIKNMEMWQEMHELLKKTPHITVDKVAGNGSDKWNDYCDKLARKLCGSKPKRK